MNKPHNIALLLLSISMGSTGIAQAVVIDSPVSWAAHASTAVGNCTPACGLIVSDSEGGIDATSATASIAYPFGSPPDDAFAQATLSGTSLTPTLRARATSTGNDVEAFANGIQSYTNTGTARTIVLDLSLSANVTPGSSPGGKANATANLGVFLTDELSYFATDLGSQLEGERGKMVGADTANTDDDGSLRLSISGVNGYMTP